MGEEVAELRAERIGISADEADASFVNSLLRAKDAKEFCRAWLTLQCRLIPEVAAALLLLDDNEGHFSTAAAWPVRKDLTYLAEAAQEAISRRTPFIHRSETGTARAVHLAQPIECRGQLKGVVVAHLPVHADTAATLQKLQWGTGWLQDLFGRQAAAENKNIIVRSDLGLQVLAEAQRQPHFRPSAFSVANELATRLHCSRVSVGVSNGQNVSLVALSHTAFFEKKSQLVDAIENAMEEAGDQHASVAAPSTPHTGRRVNLAHEGLLRSHGSRSAVSVLMKAGDRVFGVILLERDDGNAFDDGTIDLLESVATLLGPELHTKAALDRLVTGRAVQVLGSGFQAVFGSGRPLWKISAVLAVLALAYVSLVPTDFRVSAKAVVEGAVQRATVAPFDGYLKTAPLRAGAIVEAGDVLASLDDRDLKFEAARWQSQYDQEFIKYNDAIGKHDRTTALVSSAALDETKAQLSLVKDKLARAVIRAPFKGVIASGDLNQLIGSPIEKGKVLFELTPLETFRVILQVDEREIGFIKEGQSGNLVLTGMPSDRLPFDVKTITPVATASEGRNFFRVEADVHGKQKLLRPGMEGIAKITVDERSLLAIWSRPILDWARIVIWKWTP